MSILEDGDEALKIIEKETGVALDDSQRSKLLADYFTHRCIEDAKYDIEDAKRIDRQRYSEQLFNSLPAVVRAKATEKYSEQFAPVRLAQVMDDFLDNSDEAVIDKTNQLANDRVNALKAFGLDPIQVFDQKIEKWTQDFLIIWGASIKKARGSTSRGDAAKLFTPFEMNIDQWAAAENPDIEGKGGMNAAAWIDIIFAAQLGGGFLLWFDPDIFGNSQNEKLDYKSMQKRLARIYTLHEGAKISEMILSAWNLDGCHARELRVDTQTLKSYNAGKKSLIRPLLRARARNWWREREDWRGETDLDYLENSLQARLAPAARDYEADMREMWESMNEDTDLSDALRFMREQRASFNLNS